VRLTQLAHSFISSNARNVGHGHFSDVPCGRAEDSIRELVLAIEVLVVQLLEVANELPAGPERARVLKDVAWLSEKLAQYKEHAPPDFA
jgi:hypothetical protein